MVQFLQVVGVQPQQSSHGNISHSLAGDPFSVLGIHNVRVVLGWSGSWVVGALGGFLHVGVGEGELVDD